MTFRDTASKAGLFILNTEKALIDARTAVAAARAELDGLNEQYAVASSARDQNNLDHSEGKITIDEAANKDDLLAKKLAYIVSKALPECEVKLAAAEKAEYEAVHAKELAERKKLAKADLASFKQHQAALRKAVIAAIEPALKHLKAGLDEIDAPAARANRLYPVWNDKMLRELVQDAAAAAGLSDVLGIALPNPNFYGVEAELDRLFQHDTEAFSMALGLIPKPEMAIPLPPPPEPEIYVDPEEAAARAQMILEQMRVNAGRASPLDIQAAGGNAPRYYMRHPDGRLEISADRPSRPVGPLPTPAEQVDRDGKTPAEVEALYAAAPKVAHTSDGIPRPSGVMDFRKVKD